MPNIKSTKKRLRQSEARRLHNKSIKSRLRNSCRKVREAVDAGDIEKAEELYRVSSRLLDRAGARNLIHKNAASRTKSRLSAHIKAGKQQS